MAYGTLMRQAWRLVWSHKFLIVIAAAPQVAALIGYALNSVTGFLGMFLIMAAAVLAETSLIAAVFQIIDTGQSGYRQAWNVAWPLKWRSAGILLLAALPGSLVGGFFGAIMGAVVAVLVIAGISTQGLIDPAVFPAVAGIGVGVMLLLVGLMILVNIPFAIWGRVAIITCLCEGADVTGSLGRAWNILRANLREAIGLGLLQLAIGLLSLIILVPSLILSICPLAWPLLWGIEGAIAAWLAAVWVMAWREWAPAATNLQVLRNT